ncbi:hypothetical protein D9M71_328690 [compost metagenome]
MDRLALVEGFQLGQFLAVGLHHLGEAQQDALAVGRAQAAPHAGAERALGRGHGLLDLLRAGHHQLRERRAAGRIEYLGDLAGMHVDAAAVDEGGVPAIEEGRHLGERFEGGGGHGSNSGLNGESAACSARAPWRAGVLAGRRKAMATGAATTTKHASMIVSPPQPALPVPANLLTVHADCRAGGEKRHAQASIRHPRARPTTRLAPLMAARPPSCPFRRDP